VKSASARRAAGDVLADVGGERRMVVAEALGVDAVALHDTRLGVQDQDVEIFLCGRSACG
jgi:hypothetical protein